MLNNSKNITIVTEEEYTYSFFHCLQMWLLVYIIKPHNGKILSAQLFACYLPAALQIFIKSGI